MIFGTHLALDNSDHVLDGGPNPPTQSAYNAGPVLARRWQPLWHRTGMPVLDQRRNDYRSSAGPTPPGLCRHAVTHPASLNCAYIAYINMAGSDGVWGEPIGTPQKNIGG